MEESDNESLNEDISVEEEEDVANSIYAEVDAGEDTGEDEDLTEEYAPGEMEAADNRIDKKWRLLTMDVAKPLVGEVLSNAIAKSTGQPGKLIVRLRNRLTTPSQASQFIELLQTLIEHHHSQGTTAVFEDFDISQNSLATTDLDHIFCLLAHSCVHVERLRAFDITTLNDEVCTMLAAWLNSVSGNNVPCELHLSGCAISTEGCQEIVKALERNNAFPGLHPKYCYKVPMYLRLENNYIDDNAIQETIDRGVLTTMTKEGKPRNNYLTKAKARLLTFKGRGKSYYHQNTGEPPTVIRYGSNSNKGKGTEKSGKGKASKGSVQAAWPAPHKHTRCDAQPQRRYSSKPKCNGSRSHYHNKYNNSRSNRNEKKRYRQDIYNSSDKRIYTEYRKDLRKGIDSDSHIIHNGHMEQTNDATLKETETKTNKKRPAQSESDGSKKPSKAATQQETSCHSSQSATVSPSQSPLPCGWEQHWCKEHRTYYYFDCISGHSQWERPRQQANSH